MASRLWTREARVTCPTSRRLRLVVLLAFAAVGLSASSAGPALAQTQAVGSPTVAGAQFMIPNIPPPSRLRARSRAHSRSMSSVAPWAPGLGPADTPVVPGPRHRWAPDLHDQFFEDRAGHHHLHVRPEHDPADRRGPLQRRRHGGDQSSLAGVDRELGRGRDVLRLVRRLPDQRQHGVLRRRQRRPSRVRDAQQRSERVPGHLRQRDAYERGGDRRCRRDPQLQRRRVRQHGLVPLRGTGEGAGHAGSGVADR